MAKVYISLGTNLGDKIQNLSQAIKLINELCGNLKQKSSIYNSAPWGFESFNNFLNQVILIDSGLAAEDLMKKLLSIEHALGRTRDSKEYQDRIMDIDILFYGDEEIKSEHLSIPHPKLHERNFILQPMLELDPLFIHPVLEKSIEELTKICSDKIKAFKQ